MIWGEIFAELEAELQAIHKGEREAEVVEMVHAEAATISFGDRLRNRKGHILYLRLRHGETRSGELAEATQSWCFLHDGNRRHIIPFHAIVCAWPLSGAAPPPRGITARLSLGYALRKLASQAALVCVVTEGGSFQGHIGMVGADYCDLHTPAKVIAISWSSILTIEAPGD